MPSKTKNRTGTGGRPQKKRKNPWEPLTKAIIRRIVSRCPELKKEARQLSKDLKRLSEPKPQVKLSDISLDDFNFWKRLSAAMHGQPVSKETALESAIRLEMKLLCNPQKYPPLTKTKIKDHLLAWLYFNPIINIKILGRRTKAITPFTRLDAYKATPQSDDETIEINGFRVSKDDKPRNIVLVKYKGACMGEIADAAPKALGIEVSPRNIETVL
jgi:hypothetical protein